MLQPEDDSWAVVVYDSAGEAAVRLGSAVVIDGSRLLTCLHVIASDSAREQVCRIPQGSWFYAPRPVAC